MAGFLAAGLAGGGRLGQRQRRDRGAAGQRRQDTAAVQPPVVLGRAQDALDVVLGLGERDVVHPLVFGKPGPLGLPAHHAVFTGVVGGEHVGRTAELLHQVGEVLGTDRGADGRIGEPAGAERADADSPGESAAGGRHDLHQADGPGRRPDLPRRRSTPVRPARQPGTCRGRAWRHRPPGAASSPAGTAPASPPAAELSPPAARYCG